MTNDPTTPDHAAPKTGFMLGGSYDKAKQAALIWLPLLAAFYSTVALLWGWGYIGQVVGTITAVNTLLGATVVKSSSNYNKSDAKFDGDLNAITDSKTGEISYLMGLNTHPNAVNEQSEVVLKVKPTTV